MTNVYKNFISGPISNGHLRDGIDSVIRDEFFFSFSHGHGQTLGYAF